MTKRLFDLTLAIIGLMLFAIPMLIVAIVVRLDSRGPALHWSKRFGADGQLFTMPKFRTMRQGTPQLPTHLLTDGAAHLTRTGLLLRRSSLDELPQLWSVLRGEMSFVGPRPALFNQLDLMAMRREAGVQHLRPGITGWAQVNGRDELPLEEKVRREREYLEQAGLLFDLRIIMMTLLRGSRGISH